MAGYTRTDTTNNIADGNIINATDLDNEFDGIQAAFNSSTGHNHDGTTGEGAPILVLGPTQDVVVGASTVTPKTTNTVDIGSSSLKFKDLWLAGNANFAGTTTLGGALTYGGITLSNVVTGTGNMVLSASPTLTGTISGANASLSGTLAVTGVATLTAQPVLSSLTASRAVFTDGSKGLVSNAITGTGNVVMSASPTLTGTISAEALTLSGAVTASAGTANGVAYLNGSKVLTTGSALTFDGTNLGIGAATPIYDLQVGTYGTDADSTLALASSTTGTGSIRFGDGTSGTDANAGLIRYNHSDNSMVFWTNTSEQMRLTSTGLGIGTSSPGYKLDVQRQSYGVTAQFYTNDGTGNPRLAIYGSSSGTTIQNTWSSGASNLIFANGGAVGSGTEVARFDVNGNLGIGTSSPNARLAVAGGGIRVSGYSSNSAGDGVNVQIGTTGGVNYLQSLNGTGTNNLSIDANQVTFRTGSYATAATLDSSGNLGLGVTPSAWNSSARAFQIGTLSSLAQNDAGSFYIGRNQFNSSTGYRYLSTGPAQLFGPESNGGYAWYTAPSGTAGNAISFTQAMTLDASGNLLVGQTSSTDASFRLQLTGAGGSIHAAMGANSNALRFSNVNTSGVEWAVGTSSPGVANAGNFLSFTQFSGGSWAERARIDSSGRLLVKQTSSLMTSGWGSISIGSGATLSGPATGSDFNALLSANAYFDGAWKRIGATSATLLEMLFGGNRVQFFTAGGGSANSTITWSDGPFIANGGNTWTNGSDEKLKNITGEIEDAVAKVMQIRAARYTWKKDPDNKPQVGLIAQDLQKVLPEVVVEPPEPTDRYGNETYLGVNYDHVIPLLVAAIKELKTEFDAYKASHP